MQNREGSRRVPGPPDADTYARQLALSVPLRESVIRSAIRALQLPAGSQGLDAGCGIGDPALWLAEAIGPGGHVAGLDRCREFLVWAQEATRKAALPCQSSFVQGEVNRLPFADEAFDWAWSLDCVGYPVGEALPLVTELARVVRRGGRVAILAWTSQTLLPGHPMLEARLSATAAGVAPFVAGAAPETHFLRALGWLREAGLKDPAVRTLVGTVHAPFGAEVRDALLSLIEMRWEGARSELGPEDWRLFQRLCQPDSPEFILDLPDYYAFFTYSLFHGRAGK